MTNWNERLYQKEWIDLGPDYYSKQEYENCLVQLDRIGKWLGGDAATLKTLKKLKKAPESILDVGCGGGTFTARLAKRFPGAKVTGIDINPMAIEFAKKNNPSLPNLSFELRHTPQLIEPKHSYDVVLATLLCHHLDDQEMVEFLQNVTKIASRKVIINDLHRTSLAYYLFKLITPLFDNNPLIYHDGLLSIQRSFIYKDWLDYLQQAAIPSQNYKVSWHWMFRWIVEIDGGAV